MPLNLPGIASKALVAAPVHLPVDVWRKHWPVVLGAIALMIVVILIRGNRGNRVTGPSGPRASGTPGAARGWRVGHEGRDMMFYEEKHGGSWRRIPIDGEMLMGRAHHVIYFTSIRFPDWAEGRREEIIERIKSAFPEPDYEHDDR